MKYKIHDASQGFNLTTQKQILCFTEACEYLNLSKSTLYKLTSLNKIPFTKPNGGKIYFKLEDLNKWMLRNEVKSVSQSEEDITAKILNNGK